MTVLIVSALTSAAIYALIGTSLSLVYRASEVLNFAAGFVAVFAGIYFANATNDTTGALVQSVLIGAALGLATFFICVVPIVRRNGGPLPIAISTLGLALVLDYFAGELWEKRPFSARPLIVGGTNVFDTFVTYHRIVSVAIAFLVVAVVYIVAERTTFGWSFTAIGQDADVARLYGIRVTRYSIALWCVSGALLGLAGALLAPVGLIDRALALPLSLKGFAAMVFGGAQRIEGPVVGALLMAFLEVFLVRYVTSEYATAIVYLLLIVTLVVRPAGLLGDPRAASRT